MVFPFSGWWEGRGEWKVDRDCSPSESPGLWLPPLPSPSLPSAPLHDSLPVFPPCRFSVLPLFPFHLWSPATPFLVSFSKPASIPRVGWQLTHSFGDQPPMWAVADMSKCFLKQTKYIEIFHLLGFWGFAGWQVIGRPVGYTQTGSHFSCFPSYKSGDTNGTHFISSCEDPAGNGCKALNMVIVLHRCSVNEISEMKSLINEKF